MYVLEDGWRDTIIPPQLIFYLPPWDLVNLLTWQFRFFSLHSFLFGTTPIKLDPGEPHPFYKYIYLDATGLRQLS